ncbi:hypothetical protein RJ639_009655 [Escallonia herrerae]|uniref:non-specific serine/threonine protein kinase n=1 Tax=Escallonia herrerae TaxID=1293975 RepID=A0AA88VX84_9ASTE|nr:hypothetical protein RJ639_009655 [Escallonia herrerae]
MASTSPSPNSSPEAVPPASATTPPPPPSSPPSNSTITSPPPVSQPNQTSDTPAPSPPSTPSNSSSPPPQSPPPAVPAAPPPSPPQSPPPSATPPPTSSPPPSPPSVPPPSPPASPPPSTPAAPPPAANPPPSTKLSPPPAANPPPSTKLSPPPSSSNSSPQESPAPPVLSPPPPSPAPPPPSEAASPPSSNSPPPPVAKPPKKSPPPHQKTSPPPSGSTSTSAPPPSTSTPGSTSSPPVPSSSLPNPVSPPSPPSNSSVNGSPPLPSFPTEKPTARSATPGPNVTAHAGPRDAGGLKAGGAVAIGIVVGFLALSLVVMVVLYARKRKKQASGPNGGYILPSPYYSQNSESSFLGPQQSLNLAGSASGSNFMYSPDPGGVGNSRSWFTYEELSEATNGFSTSNHLGEGGFGCVYKGLLADGREVAVKQLKIGGGQGEREFRAEVEIISRVHHRHLVSLVGYCISEHQRLLVYDYVPNDTLDYHLHGEGRPVMDWATRIKVAAGAARGIAYLHEDCHPRIIHRDIKSSNILLDINFDAQVADFGLAKLNLDANTHVSTRVMGTFGYMAPEYASSGKLTEKSDVFSFGVVLLELITGRKPVDASQPLGDESLVEWARPLLMQALEKEDFEELVDPRLEKNFVAIEMFRMIEAAAACVRHLATKRPRMSQVVRALDSIFEFSDLTNGMKPGQSQIFDSREQSAEIRMFQRMAFGSQDYSSDFFNHSQSSWRS